MAENSTHTWTVDEDSFIIQHAPNTGQMSFVQIGDKLGKLTKNQVRGRYLRLRENFLKWLHDGSNEQAGGDQGPAAKVTKDTPGVEWDQGTDSQVVTVVSDTVRTLEDALKTARVDLTVWDVERKVINKWDCAAKRKQGFEVVELWQVKVWLQRKTPSRDENVVQALVQKLKAFTPAIPPVNHRRLPVRAEHFMLEVSPMDLHVGKYCWAAETGTDYDLKIAGEDFMHALETALSYVHAFPIGQVLFPVGNDLIHVDTPEGTTAAGTRQDVDTRWQKLYMKTYDLMTLAINRLRLLAPVKVLVIPGNHDTQLCFTMGHSLECTYRNARDVDVDNRPTRRKYFRYGVNLLGFTHGHKEKKASLPLIMAQECPADWAAATTKEWHVGHLHKRALDKYTAGDSHQGVGVRILPSLSGTDAWHAEMGYVKGPRALEAYLWGLTSGYAGHFSANVPPEAHTQVA